MLDAHVSIDETDCTIMEPSPFYSQWWSHKLKGAALRYEEAVSVHAGNIFWAHSARPAGVPDITIFRTALKQKLESDDEFAVVVRCIQPPGEHHPLHFVLRRFRAKYENENARLEMFMHSQLSSAIPGEACNLLLRSSQHRQDLVRRRTVFSVPHQ